MRNIAFSEQSSDQRQRRALAHSRLAQLDLMGKAGERPASEVLDDAFRAVLAASTTTKSPTEEYAGRLGKVGIIMGDLSAGPDSGVQLWVPRTYFGQRSIRLDGYVTDGQKHKVLDIAALGDTCCVTTEEGAEAAELWSQGEVLLTNTEQRENRPTLVVPEQFIPPEIVDIALRRHFGVEPQAVLQ